MQILWARQARASQARWCLLVEESEALDEWWGCVRLPCLQGGYEVSDTKPTAHRCPTCGGFPVDVPDEALIPHSVMVSQIAAAAQAAREEERQP